MHCKVVVLKRFFFASKAKTENACQTNGLSLSRMNLSITRSPCGNTKFFVLRRKNFCDGHA